MTEPNKERDPIRDIARQLGIQTFGDGLLVKIRETIDCLRSQAQNCAQYRAEMEIVQRQLDRFRSQSHGIPALAEIERLRAALRSCAKASSAAEVGLIVDEALAADTALDSAVALEWKGGADIAAERYTCIGKGGEYELLGLASGAGTLNGLSHMVYRNRDGVMFVREPEDFLVRMERLPTKVSDK